MPFIACENCHGQGKVEVDSQGKKITHLNDAIAQQSSPALNPEQAKIFDWDKGLNELLGGDQPSR